MRSPCGAAGPVSLTLAYRGVLRRLKTRADFLRVAAAQRKAVRPGLVLQAAPGPNGPGDGAVVRVGFTASRKIGNSVARNRAKRRLRAAAASVLPYQGTPGTDYVLIARSGTADRHYAALVNDLEVALRRIEYSGAGSPSGAAGDG